MDPLAVVGNCMDPDRFHDIPQLGHGTHWFSGTVGVAGVGLFDGNRRIFVGGTVVGVVVGAWCLVGNRVLGGILQFDAEVLVVVGSMGVGVGVGVGAEVGAGVDCKYIHHAVVEVVEGTAAVAEVDSRNLLEMVNILQFSVAVVAEVAVSVGMGMVVGIVGMGVGVLVGGDSCFLVVGVRELAEDDGYGNVRGDERRLRHGHAPRRSVDVSIYRFEFLV